MIVLVLAGGLGKRLRSVIQDVPKPMAPVGKYPFLYFVLSELVSSPIITKIVISVGYKSEKVSSYFGSQFKGIPIKYCKEVSPLGTGGAIKNFVTNMKIKSPFFVKNGDTFFKSNYTDLKVAQDLFKPKIILEACKVEKLDRYGSLELETIDRKRRLALILKFKEKDQSAKNGYINSGCYLMDPHIFDKYPKRKFSLEEDILTPFSIERDIYAIKSEEKEFIDIGIPSDFYAAQKLLPKWSL